MKFFEILISKNNAGASNEQKGMQSAIRNIFPKIVAMATDAQVSNNCSAGILKWIVNIRHMKKWALESKCSSD